MAKKNHKAAKHFFSEPMSFKLVLFLGILSFGLLYTNITTTQKQWKEDDDRAFALQKKMAQIDIVKILGATTIPNNEEADFKKDKTVNYWYSVIGQKPQYRDAYLILATIAYNQRRCELAKKHLTSAYILDPILVKNNPIFQTIDHCEK
jgi:hypothetical protein